MRLARSPGSQISSFPPPPRRVSPPAQFPIVRGSDVVGHGWSAGNTLNPRKIMELEVVAKAGIEPATRGFSTQRRAPFGAAKPKKRNEFSTARRNPDLTAHPPVKRHLSVYDDA